MRRPMIWAGLVVLLVMAVVGRYNPNLVPGFASEDHRFEGYTHTGSIEVSRAFIPFGGSIRQARPTVARGSEIEKYFEAIRAKCGGWREVLADVESAYKAAGPEGVAEFEEVEDNYSDILAVQAMQRAVEHGSMHPKCLVEIGSDEFPAMKQFALWTTSGDDYIFGYEEATAFSPLSKLDRRYDCCQYDTIRVGNFLKGYNGEMQKRLIVVGLKSAPLTAEQVADQYPTGSINR